MSLKKAAKERLLWAIKQVVVPFGRIIMLVDPKSLKIISSCCSVSDLLDEGVDLVELLTKKREPLKGKYVLCMLSDDFTYLDLLFKDFVRGKENYMGVFIMFNCHLKDDTVLRRIASEMEFDKVLGCFELHLNFVTFESNVFFTQNYYFKDLYNLLFLSSRTPNTLNAPGNSGRYMGLESRNELGGGSKGLGKSNTPLDEYIDRVASRIASVCSVLNVKPKVSYYKNKYGLTGRVASAVENLLSETLDKNASPDSELIIFDRSIDLAPAFIHEYTYQAFIYDMLQVNYCTYQDKNGSAPEFNRTNSSLARKGTTSMDSDIDNCFKYKFITNSNKEEDKQALLDPELDVLYREYRHLHIQQVNTRVSQEIHKFSDEAAHQTKGERSMQNTLQLVRKLPEYQYTFEKFWAHLRLSERCFKYVETKKLLTIGAIEQAIATNMDSTGKHMSHTKVHEKLQEVLSEQLDEGDKVRLILLYLSNYHNLNKGHLVKLTSKLSPASLNVLNNIMLSLPLSNINFNEMVNSTEAMSYDQSPSDARGKDDKSKEVKVTHRIEKGDLYSYYKKVHIEYELSRYLSEVIFVLLQYINNHYSHPLLQTTAPKPAAAEKKTKKTDNLEGFNLLFRSSSEERKKVVVYVLGGISLSECREVYKLSERKNVEVYLGGDEILIPSRIVEDFAGQ